ncbi:vacuolar protein sorting-associated protein 60.2-like isoform X2 [Rutidosis leptorrhynchoides]|uniref:vacuolar protein sorting-associated protein 60.2-like isoform X2 n=1 Tax=Rutidosis leptorrhynchoides TaxID=125765 RepID=UPI003A9A3BCE
MKRVFGAKKDKEPPPSLNDASDRINKRGESVDEKIKRLDGELARYKEQIKRTRPGPAQEAVKARAMRVLKQKKMYEGQRDMLYNQTFNLDQVAFAQEGIKDAQQTMSALKSANKELKGMMKTVKIQEIDNLMLWRQTWGWKLKGKVYLRIFNLIMNPIMMTSTCLRLPLGMRYQVGELIIRWMNLVYHRSPGHPYVVSKIVSL